MNAGARDIAIVGLGPKGTYALERLLEHAHRTNAPARSMRITAFETETPGCGPNYSPSQPAFLLMNFAASQVDAWPPDNSFVPRTERLSYVDWCSRRATTSSGDDYPPRADVGCYLQWCLETMLAHRSKRVDWKLVRERITSVERVTDGWALRSESRRGQRFDAVIFCTGHRWSDGSRSIAENAVPCLPAFPVDTLMRDRPFAPGTVVAVRGFALSFIDAALALTEGRGGAFVPGPVGPMLRYVSSGREPGAIVPFSRSGLPMAVKPPPDRFRRLGGVERAAARARARVLALPAGFSIEADLMPVVTGLGDEIARSSGARTPAPTSDVRVMIERAIAMAVGSTPPDQQACIGEAWRLAYPAVVERLGHGGLSDDEYPGYRRIAASMERIAFGPPPLNAAKLLALADAGIVRLERTDSVPVCAIDGLVDAVLPRPGVDAADPGPLGTLIRAGVLTLDGRRGVRVDDSAHCLGGDGRPVPGLACAGRPTEDWVIGNDTLSRRLHPDLDRWARSLVFDSRANGHPKTRSAEVEPASPHGRA